MNLPTNYDDWRLDNDEQTEFVCPDCYVVKPIEDLAHNDEICNDCLEAELEKESES